LVDETFTELKPVETFAQEFETVAEWGSGTVELADGNVLTGHNLVSFASLDDTYQLNLVYDSERANLESYFLEVERSTDSTELDQYRLVTNVTVEGINLEGQEVQTLSVGVDAGEFGLVKGDTIWQLQPDDDNDSEEYTATAAVELDLSNYQTGLYPATIDGGILPYHGNQFHSTGRSVTSESIVVVNQSESAFGSGWNLAGLQEIYLNDRETALLVDGNGSELIFQNANAVKNDLGYSLGNLFTDAPTQYISPAGDFSTLEFVDEWDFTGFRRTLKDQTVYQFAEHQ